MYYMLANTSTHTHIYIYIYIYVTIYTVAPCPSWLCQIKFIYNVQFTIVLEMLIFARRRGATLDFRETMSCPYYVTQRLTSPIDQLKMSRSKIYMHPLLL